MVESQKKNNSMFYPIKNDDTNCHLNCPHCQCGIDIRWNTEYSDPVDGEHMGKCPGCGKEFEFNVEVTVNYTPIPVKPQMPH